MTVDDEEMVPVTFTAAEEVIPAADRVPVMSAGPPTTRLAVASKLETEIVPPERRLLTVRLDVETLEAESDLSAPVMVTLSDEVIPAAERVPVAVRLRPCASPVTVNDEPSIAPAESVPVISTGPPTTRLAVASMLLTEMVPPERRLLTVRLDVSMLLTVRILSAPEMVTLSEEVRPAVERVPVTSTGPPTTRLAVASMLETDMVPPDNLLLTVRFEVLILDTVRILSAPEMVTFSDEVMPAAERVPVDVKLRPCAVPETTRSVPVTVDDEEIVPVTFTAAEEVIPAADRVPVDVKLSP